jgi:sucrose-6-phosphate hydrolase SacC (GH32 family)
MSLPRTLRLGKDGRLEMSFAPPVESLRGERQRVENVERSGKEKSVATIRIHNLAADIQVEFGTDRSFLLRLKSEKGEPFAEIAYQPDAKGEELRVNAIKAPLTAEGSLSLRLIFDGSSLEVLANHKTAITARIYMVPSAPLTIEVSNLDALRTLDIWRVKPISPDRLTS